MRPELRILQELTEKYIYKELNKLFNDILEDQRYSKKQKQKFSCTEAREKVKVPQNYRPRSLRSQMIILRKMNQEEERLQEHCRFKEILLNKKKMHTIFRCGGPVDRMWQNGLIAKMQQYGFSRIEVPQGSIQSPALDSIYTSDVPRASTHIKTYIYAVKMTI